VQLHWLLFASANTAAQPAQESLDIIYPNTFRSYVDYIVSYGIIENAPVALFVTDQGAEHRAARRRKTNKTIRRATKETYTRTAHTQTHHTKRVLVRKRKAFMPATTDVCSLVSWLACQMSVKRTHTNTKHNHTSGLMSRCTIAGTSPWRCSRISSTLSAIRRTSSSVGRHPSSSTICPSVLPGAAHWRIRRSSPRSGNGRETGAGRGVGGFGVDVGFQYWWARRHTFSRGSPCIYVWFSVSRPYCEVERGHCGGMAPPAGGVERATFRVGLKSAVGVGPSCVWPRLSSLCVIVSEKYPKVRN